MSYDPDAAPWAERAAEIAAGSTALLDRVEFANPWHDHLGRFAPKGTGRLAGSRVIGAGSAITDADWALFEAAMMYVDGRSKTTQRFDKLKVNPTLNPNVKKAMQDVVDNRDDVDKAAAAIDVMVPVEGEFDLSAAAAEIPKRTPRPVEDLGGGQFAVQAADGTTLKMTDKSGAFDEATRVAALNALANAYDMQPVRNNLYGVDQAPQLFVHSPEWWARNSVPGEAAFVHVDSGFLSTVKDPHVIHLNPAAKNEIYIEAGRMDTSGVVPQIEFTIAHEYGHLLVNADRTRIDSGWSNPQLDEHYRRALARGMNDVYAGQMSQYGLSSKAEAQAESFADWVVTGGASSNTLTRAAVQLFGWGTESLVQPEDLWPT